MAATRKPGLLSRVAVTGVAGLPELALELGPITALVGPRGSGKSQLLSAVAWLLGCPRAPALVSSMGHDRPTHPLVSGSLVQGRVVELVRGSDGRWLRPRDGSSPTLPGVSFLRAADRLRPSTGTGGEVADLLASRATGLTTDGAAAEALLDAVAACCDDGVSGEVLLIEEPELQLTPQAQRYLYTLLRRFAHGDNQILYTTRSAAFVDAAHHDEIVRLDRQAAGTIIRHTEPDARSDHERLRLAAEFDHERSEMFFARAVVLVEGRTERLSLPFIFRAFGHDPDGEGIAIVEVGGKSNLPLAARLLRQLAIPFVVVFDADRGLASAALDSEIERSAGTASIVRLDPNFEAAAGIRGHDDKVFRAWQRFARAGPEVVPAALADVVRTATALVGAAGS